MHVNRAADAASYQAPGHFGVESIRLQGRTAGGAEFCAVSVSNYEPGAGVDDLPVDCDTVYVILSGELEVTSHDDGQTVVLGEHDSVHIPRGERRSIRNRSGADTKMLVVLAPVPQG